jgi:hypothetical protein
MPSTINKKKMFSGCVDEEVLGGAGEASAEPVPPPGVRETAWKLSDDLVEGAVEQARLRRALADLGPGQRAELVSGLLAELGGEQGELGDAVCDELLGALVRGKRGEAEILGPDGVLGELTRRLIERALGEELSEALGYPAGHAPPGGTGNPRNGQRSAGAPLRERDSYANRDHLPTLHSAV